MGNSLDLTGKVALITGGNGGIMSEASRYHTGDSLVIDGAYTIF